MANALKKCDYEQNAVSLDMSDALAAAFERAASAGPLKSNVLEFISKDEWQNMDASEDNILVYDPS